MTFGAVFPRVFRPAFGPGLASGNGLLNGLLTYWPLDETSGTRYDAHSNGYDMTEVGTPGGGTGHVYSNAMLLDEDIDAFITRSRATSGLVNFSASTPMTASIWFYPTSFSGGPDSPDYYKVLYSFNYSSSFSGGWRIQLTASGQIYVNLGKTGGPPGYDIHTGLFAILNAWNFVAFTHDANNLIYYHDADTPITDTNVYGWTAATNGSFNIGARNNAGGQYVFDGRLGPGAIWNRALSGAEIATLRNGGVGLAYSELTL